MLINKEYLKRELNELNSWFIIFKKTNFYYKSIFYIIFPVFVFFVFLLFKNTGNLLKFDLTALGKVWTYFTHSYFHNSWDHLIQNLQGYIILTALLYVLYYKKNLLKLLKRAYLFLFFTMPFVTVLINYSAYKLYLEKPFPPMSGSSDIVSAIIGLSFYSIIILLDLRNKYDKSISFLLYFTPLSFVLYFEPIFLHALLIIFIPNYLWVLYKSIKNKFHFSNLVYFVFLFISVSAFTILIFPKEIITNGGVINTISHLGGLLYGLLIGYIVVLNVHSAKKLAQKLHSLFHLQN
jgi:hypothetical protein